MRPHNVSHALVVGGTGMLREVSLSLARQGWLVSVIGRNVRRLQSLKEEALSLSGKINPFSLDYRDSDQLINVLQEAEREGGPIGLVVAWIHGVAPEAPHIVAQQVSGGPCRYFHVLGSASRDPSQSNHWRRARLAKIDDIRYREVILGFMIEKGASRWLTDKEICTGILEAVEEDQERTIVGTVHPWSACP